jgi:adenylate cyclase
MAIAPIPRPLIDKIADWLMQQTLDESDLESVVVGCCERLRAAGLPLVRGYFAFNTLHPLHRAIGITWNRGKGTKVDDYPHHPGGLTEQYRRSPHFYMAQRRLDFMRISLDCDQRQYDFPILDELRQEAITDYVAFLVDFDSTQKRGMSGSWATDRGAGFSESDVDVLLRIQRWLAVAAKMALKTQLTRNLVETYLGRGAGEHVLSGLIKRGDGQSIKAAIWFADIRSSTALADTLPSQHYIDTLNGFFDATGGAVGDAGGEVLSFIGDGLLAIFPTDSTQESVGEACKRALAAALDAEQRLAVFNGDRRATGKPVLGYGIALHLGEVMYGNVGVAQRLSFSAFGSAVNEVSRLDQLTKTLREPVLASDDFVSMLHIKWRPLGSHILRGVDRPMTVFAPPAGRTLRANAMSAA